MSGTPRTRHLRPDNELKAQLRQRHWQTHGTFLREYDKAAAQIDEKLVGTGPLKAQFYRWLGGEIKTHPYPDHCRVLEAMLPGYNVETLFGPAAPRPRPIDREQLRAAPLQAGGEFSTPDSAAAVTPVRDQREVTAVIDARVRSLMSWIGDSAPIKERDLHGDQPVRQSVDRRRSR
ncbi:hypothetical protein ACFYTS_02205 [Nocardia sp. NPDC004151]|uniref:hypothetical protein n=1 Tax=Nocardia sp. NPDC004151 TaxID=3364304 RepID=UPI0036CF363D